MTSDHSSEADVHAPEQYPWEASHPVAAHEGPEGENQGDGDTPTERHAQLVCTEDPADERSNECPSAPDMENEEEELRRLHADVLVRFHLQKPSPESDDEGAPEHCAPSLPDSEVDPELGEFHPATGGVRCKLCDMPLNSKKQWQDHFKGQKHEKVRRRKEREAQAASTETATSHILTVRTITCTSNEAGRTQLWGAWFLRLPISETRGSM